MSGNTRSDDPPHAFDAAASGIEWPRLAPEVLVVEVGRRGFTNFNYIVFDRISRDAVIVDPAWELDRLVAMIDQHRLRLRAVLITHSHPDHLNLAEPIAEHFDCSIWMSPQEVAWARFQSDRLRCIAEARWRIGTLEVEALLTPGHTPGCVCYRIVDNLFSGDVLFAEGCGLCMSNNAAQQMFDSLELLKQQLAGNSRIYPGHSYGKPPGQLFANVLRDNIYLQFKDPDSFVRFRMRSGQGWMKAFR
ncbi:MBL fold metallo-hydrolase [Pseudomarimonas arenosa]|uniref:MBL fold metallo-hydrolase n=1 Tax=Pseudomarimonas arenosa TaxID=2774145 RepID=A0AAW3ZIJ8_9GAMM|nr:MBL fold metallo-hydrolase [Pseudomarimonas arenosa]MBD8525918.1 MBL fold metallo-hydrolase [Pseudomarimonas arenosa]